jgi:hypothetical protein
LIDGKIGQFATSQVGTPPKASAMITIFIIGRGALLFDRRQNRIGFVPLAARGLYADGLSRRRAAASRWSPQAGDRRQPTNRSPAAFRRGSDLAGGELTGRHRQLVRPRRRPRRRRSRRVVSVKDC